MLSKPQQPDNEARIHSVWTTVAVLFLVAALLLAGTTVALGTVACHTRKGMKSGWNSNHSTDKA